MPVTLETAMLILLCVITGLLLVAVLGSGYLVSRRATQRCNDLDNVRQALARRVAQYQNNQRQLQDIVIKLNGEIKHLQSVVEDQQQAQQMRTHGEPAAGRPVQDYERVVSLFSQGNRQGPRDTGEPFRRYPVPGRAG